jgi:hypothetical protein
MIRRITSAFIAVSFLIPVVVGFALSLPADDASAHAYWVKDCANARWKYYSHPPGYRHPGEVWTDTRYMTYDEWVTYCP